MGEHKARGQRTARRRVRTSGATAAEKKETSSPPSSAISSPSFASSGARPTCPPPAALARRGRAFGRADRADRAARDGWRRSALSAADAAASSRGADAVATAPPRAFPRGSRASRKTFRKRVALFSFSPTRREIVFAAGDAPWSRGPGRGRHRGHRRRSVGTRVEDATSAERSRRVARLAGDATLRGRRGSFFAIPSGEKATVRVERERPNRQVAITHLVRELVGVTLVDRLGGEEESGTVLGSHLRGGRWSRTGGAGQSPGDAMARGNSHHHHLRDRNEKRDRARRRAGVARPRAARAGSASTARARRVAARVVP